MNHVAKAKIFINGRSQAVRLPSAFRFDSTEVFIRKDPATGDVVLSKRPHDWNSFFHALNCVDIPDDFLSDIDRKVDDSVDPFEDWQE